jgi:hypothetical protein
MNLFQSHFTTGLLFITGCIISEEAAILSRLMNLLALAISSALVGYCFAVRKETGSREGFVPREIEAESVIKLKSKEDAMFLDTVLTILVNGTTNIEAIQIKLMECGYFITYPELKIVLWYFKSKGLIDYNEEITNTIMEKTVLYQITPDDLRTFFAEEFEKKDMDAARNALLKRCENIFVGVSEVANMHDVSSQTVRNYRECWGKVRCLSVV